MSHPVFNFIPAFYKNQIVNENGYSLLEPLFNEYSKYLGDCYYRLQQCSLIRSIDLCPSVVEEIYKVIDLSEDNRDKNSRGQRFFIDPSIVAFDALYYDAGLSVKCNATYSIQINELDGFTCICFDPPIDAKEIRKLYAYRAYHNYNLLRDIWGKILNHAYPQYSYSSLDAFISSCELYRSKLIGLLFGLMNASSLANIKKSVSLFTGLTHAPMNGLIKSIDGNVISIQDFDSEVTVTCKEFNSSKFHVGSEVGKYDILDIERFMVYDIFSDPARFTQYILSNNGEVLYNQILNIDINNNEKYAALLFDDNLSFDGDGLFFDMGNNTGISHDVAPGTTNYDKPWVALVDNFKNYTDSRIDNFRLYEMLRNIFIVEFETKPQDDVLQEIGQLIHRIKPSRCKCILDGKV